MTVAKFSVCLALVLLSAAITIWSARRSGSASGFFAAGRRLTGWQNGFATAGEYLSTSAFLGNAGIIFVAGFDGVLFEVVSISALMVLLVVIADRMRNAGKYTFVDLLAARLKPTPTRSAATVASLVVIVLYMLTLMVAAGTLLRLLTGWSWSLSVLVSGIAMVAYVIFGGMYTATLLQIVKAVLLMLLTIVLAVIVLVIVKGDLGALFDGAASRHPKGNAYLGPNLFFTSPLNTISLGASFIFGTAGLPHILMRFVTVRDGRTARTSMAWTVGIVSLFFALIVVLGVGARALLTQENIAAALPTGNDALPLLAEQLGGGKQTLGGALFVATISGVALFTILAVVAGLLVSASAAISHDLWTGVIRRDRRVNERQQVRVGRIGAVIVATIGVLLAMTLGAKFNIAALVALAFGVAASANFPALVLTLMWRRFTTTGAVVGITSGLASAVALITMSPGVWPFGESPTGLTYPTVISLPIGIAGCIIGTLLSRREPRAEAGFDELSVRAETGLGAEETSAGVVQAH